MFEPETSRVQMLCCRNTIRNERFDSKPARNHNSCHSNGRSGGICWSTRSEVPHKWTHGHLKWLSLYLYYHSALCLALEEGRCMFKLLLAAGLVSTRACVLLKKTLLWRKSTAESELYLFCCCISKKWTLSDQWCDYLKIVCVHGLWLRYVPFWTYVFISGL